MQLLAAPENKIKKRSNITSPGNEYQKGTFLIWPTVISSIFACCPNR
jgi:hypothetical protein